MTRTAFLPKNKKSRNPCKSKDSGTPAKSRCDKIRTCDLCVPKTMERRLDGIGRRCIKTPESIDFTDFFNANDFKSGQRQALIKMIIC